MMATLRDISRFRALVAHTPARHGQKAIVIRYAIGSCVLVKRHKIFRIIGFATRKHYLL